MNWTIFGVVIDLITRILSALTGSKPKAQLDKDDDPFNEGDHWYDWKGIDYATFWERIEAIEAAGGDSPDAMAAEATALGLPGLKGYSRVKATFMRHFDSDPAFMQAVMDLRMGQAADQMANAAANEGLLEPVEGVTIETYATLAGQVSRIGDDPAIYHKTLAEAGLDAETFERVQATWLQRMRSSQDPMGAAAIATAYGTHFAAASTGPMSAQATQAEPCSLERYAEIMGAQGAWHKEGRDIHTMLGQTFGLSAVDWSDIGMYWMTKCQQDVGLATRVGDLTDHYEAAYRTTSSADADLVI